MAARRPNSPDAVAEAALLSGAWLRPGRHLFAGACVMALGLFFSLQTTSLEQRRDMSERRAQVQSDLSDFRARLETDIYASVALVRGLAVQVVLQDGLSDLQFQATAEELLRGQPHILSLSLAPDFVIRDIYPLEGNEAAIGLDLLSAEPQAEAMKRTIEEDGPLVAGPFDLVQGGRGLAIRVPVRLDDGAARRHWGSVNMTLDYDQTLDRAGIAVLERSLRIDIVGRDATGPGGETIRGPRLPPADDPLKVPVFLPGGSWLISAVPREGWNQRAWWEMPGTLVRLALSLLAGLATARILFDRRRIRHLASLDVLTQLHNRRWALQQLARLIARGERGGGSFALFSLDLDGFKPVNDSHGHAAGDRVLAEIGQRLADVVRPGDLVARVGGDEFLVLVPTDADMDEHALRAVAQRIEKELARPVAIGGHHVAVGASIGIARYPEDGREAEVLLHKADEAMYRAKSGVGEPVSFARGEWASPAPGDAR